MGCTPSILSDNQQRKDSDRLYCDNGNGDDSLSFKNSEGVNNSINKQILINALQTKNQGLGEKEYIKKDSIVSVAGFGHSGYTIIPSLGRRSTSGASSTTSGRLGHRKSSLALTPEDEPLDISPRHFSDIKVPNLIPPNPMLRILLVFPKTDPVYDALVSACQRLSVEPSLAKTNEAALELFQNVPNGGHHIIVVDSRNSRFAEAETLGRSIRNSKGNQHAIMVAVVKKSVFEKDDTAVVSLLDAGYNRCIIESPHVSICCSELRQIQHSLVRPQNVISTQQALYTALHRAKDGIIITDDTLRTQFANKSSERLLNLKIDEIIGRPLTDLISIDGNNIISHTSRHREFDGNISIRRKSQDIISVHYKVIPVTCVGRTPTHLVITMDCGNLNGSDTLPTIPQAKEAPRGSLHSIRRGSFDVRSIASDGLRRTSLAKLSSLPLEAPITKVLTILTQVQEGCSYEEAKLIDRVMEFLKREGLYSPQMKEIKTDDPVANDLIGALLTQGPTSMLSSRRSSNDSIIRGGRQSSITTIAKIRTPSEVTDLLETALNWDFEIFRLEELTEKRPLLYLGNFSDNKK